MREELEILLNEKQVVDRILSFYEFYGKMSATFLAHKFKLNPKMAYAIMDIIKKYEPKRELKKC